MTSSDWAIGGLYATAIVGLIALGLNTWTSQRAAANEHKAQRQLRVMDIAVAAAVDFLAAADRAARATLDRPGDLAAFDAAKSSGNEAAFEIYRARLAETQESRRTAWLEAETALVALRLLLPTAANHARRFLDACQEADYTADSNAERQRLRALVEDTVAAAIGLRAG